MAMAPRSHDPYASLRVEVANHFPVFDLPAGRPDVGDLLVAITLRNGTYRPVKVTSWGLRLPNGQQATVTTPTTSWEPRLPHWVQPGDEGTWYFDAKELRRIAAEGCLRFDSMRAVVSLADGRSILAERGVPLE